MAHRTNLDCVKGDQRTIEYRDWCAWLSSLATLISRFDTEVEVDALAYHETASVSMLAGATAHAGFLSLAVLHGQGPQERSTVRGRALRFLDGQRRPVVGF